MTYEAGEIWIMIRDYLAGIYPQSVVTADPTQSLTARIATRITPAQVERVLGEMEADKEIVIYRSKRLGLAEISAVGGPDYYSEVTSANEGGYVPATSADLSGPYFLKSLESALDNAEGSVRERVTGLEQRYMSRMLQAFGVMAAIFTLVVTVVGLTSGLFDIYKAISVSMNAWVAIGYLALVSCAVFTPVGLIAWLLIRLVRPGKYTAG